MNLQKAVEILKIEKGIAELDISNNKGNQHTQDFIDATNVVFNFIYDVVQINKIGKNNE